MPSMGLLRLATLTVTLAALPSIAAAQRTDEDWLERCQDQDRGDLVKHCDVRVFPRLRAPAGPLRVDPGANGGVSVVGWDRNEVEVHARIEARAETLAQARVLAEEVRIETGGVIGADGPSNHRDANWHVSFVVYVPARSNLELSTRNGPLSVRGVRGTMDLQAQNGPISLNEVAGDVRARAQNGPINIELGGRRWEGAGLDAETRNGPINLSVPDGFNADLETGTVNGPFTSEIPLSVTLQGRLRGPLNAKLGDGGPPIRVVTTNGPVRIRRS